MPMIGRRAVGNGPRRQLERLRRGELPKADISSVEEIRRMRQERTDELERRSRKTTGT
jgi:hypothetical protein